MERITIELELTPTAIQAAVSKLTLIAAAIGGTVITSETTGIAEDVVVHTAPDNVVGITTSPTDTLVEVDGSNMPWDARIHAGSKTKSGSGLWKKKRGVSEELLNQVTDELLGKSTPEDDEYDDEDDADMVFGNQPQTSTPIESTPNTGPMTFQELMSKTTAAMTAGFIDFPSVTAILQNNPGTNGVPAKHIGMLAGAEYKDCIGPIAVAISQHVLVCGGGDTW